MAEIAEIFEEVEETIGEETEEVEGMTEEEVQEVEEVGQEASENVNSLQEISEEMKKMSIPEGMKKFATIVINNTIAAAVFTVITVLLQKVLVRCPPTEKKAYQEKMEKIKALSDFLKQLTQTAKIISKWISDNKNLTITLEGIDVPLVDIFTKYTNQMAKDEGEVSGVAKGLITKKDGKSSFKTPTTGQVATIIAASKDFVSALQQFFVFAEQNKIKFPQLNSLPISMEDVVTLAADLKHLEELPYA